ncbi:MAG: type II toxin-antitoxin system PemK/MazF family toxin [Hormoscilla sp. GUM202]|nr:type II toxin-antitoxin system PemK/MazF family toxin [Hormoscilla sp. GUM202]
MDSFPLHPPCRSPAGNDMGGWIGKRSGSIWIVRFEPSVGTEFRQTRPALVISASVFNAQRTR